MRPIIYTLLLLMVPTTAFAIDCGPGHFMGYFEGNDDVAAVNAALGIEATLLGKVNDPPALDGNLIINVDEWGGFDPLTGAWVDPIAGTWTWSGVTNVNLMTYKANGGWAAYCVLDPCADPDPEWSKRLFLSSALGQNGEWDTRWNLGGKGLSHASAWSVDCVHAPEPSTLRLVGIVIVAGIFFTILMWRPIRP